MPRCDARADYKRGLRFAFAVAVASLLATAAWAQGTSLAAAIKATYLYKIASFVEWPEQAFSSPTSPLRLCVVGDDPFGDLLDRAVAGQLVGERPVAVHHLRVVDPGANCHILYVAGSSAQPIDGALASVRGTPVLTVTDSATTARAGGIIHFVIVDDRVRFAIDIAAAAENRLAISSKLLGLAVAVKSER
jgi:hypothetical protein